MNKTYIIIGAMLFIGTSFADTETINWYVDGSQYASTTCESGGDVNLPATTPSKTGYNFVGWEVALYDFSTLNTSINGSGSGSGTSWSVNFSYGSVRGKSLCSATIPVSNSTGTKGNPDESVSGEKCWCKVLTFRPKDSLLVYEPVSTLSWVYNNYATGSDCASKCAFECGYRASVNADARRGMFNQ